jgi:5,6-dimethylbenzimidazole synthase
MYRSNEQFYNRIFTSAEKEIFYNVLFSRRDVRKRFANRNIDDKTIYNILKVAHHAPSVGFSQPWNFILIKDNETRQRLRTPF